MPHYVPARETEDSSQDSVSVQPPAPAAPSTTTGDASRRNVACYLSETLQATSLHQESSAASATGIERELAERERLEDQFHLHSEFWRDEVAHRVQSYRTRRSRKRLAGEFSMKLDFEGERPSFRGRTALAARLDEELSLDVPLLPAIPARTHQQAPELLEDAAPAPMAASGLETKVIQFPGPMNFEPVAVYELAEPILDRPRILEAPEAVEEEIPLLAQLQLEPPAEEDADSAPKPDFQVPLQGAPWQQRCRAALLDSALVLLGATLFTVIVARSATDLPYTRATLALIMGIVTLFWAVYHYIFLVHAGFTPGMQLARLVLNTFDEGTASRRLRRWRALLMVLSCASLGLGFLWAFFDEDNLCWHDRMTRTYLKTVTYSETKSGNPPSGSASAC